MIFRDNKSHDCGVNEVTDLQKKEKKEKKRATVIARSSWNWRPTDIQFVLQFEGQVAAAQIALARFHFSVRTLCSLTLPAILPNAISPAPDNKLYDRELSGDLPPSPREEVFARKTREQGISILSFRQR